MVGELEYRQKHENLSYAELINVRDSLLKRIRDFERSEKHGLRSFEDWSDEVTPDIIYSDNLTKLMIIIELMDAKYERNTLMVDITSPNEQLAFIRNVIWSLDLCVSEEFRNSALTMLDKLVKEKNAEAINIKGAMYFEGVCVEEDKKKAFTLYRRAAKLGSSLAMSNIGYAYLYGIGTKKNLALAFNNLSMAVQYGEWDAFTALGDMYLNGLYVKRDESMAFKLYDRCYEIVPHDSDNDAYPAILVRIGECFLHGKGVEVNYNTSYRLLREAKRIYDIQTEACNYYSALALERVEKDLEEVEDALDRG